MTDGCSCRRFGARDAEMQGRSCRERIRADLPRSVLMATPSMPVAGIRPDASIPQPGHLIVRNAKVHTCDPAQSSASAVAIPRGLFVDAGDDAAMAPHVGTHTRVIEALGRRVIPGLNDSH